MTQPNKNVPKLRFPEFSGEWSENSFGSIFDFQPTNSFSRALLNYENGTVKNIHYGDIHTNYKSLFDISKEEVPYINPSVDISKIKNDAYLKEGDVVIADASEDYADIGKAIEITHLNNQSTVAGLHTYIARPKSAPQSCGFYGNILKTFSVRKQVMKLATGASVLGISKTNYAKVILKTPHEIEQQKIADFLSAVDERVDGLRRKKELLERYKKGVMQKIFSQEIRFTRPDGSAYPDWEEYRLDKIFNVTRGQVLAVPLMRQTKDELYQYPVYSSQTKNNGLCGYYDKFLFENAITWTTDGANAGEVKYREGKFYCTNVCGVLISSDGYANKCVAEAFNIVSKRYVSYVGNPKLMNNVVAGIKVIIPKSVTEQLAISDFLTSVDKKVEATALQLEEAQKFKKALLQQMFV